MPETLTFLKHRFVFDNLE